jgi:hypothetical protein
MHVQSYRLLIALLQNFTGAAFVAAHPLQERGQSVCMADNKLPPSEIRE